MTPPVLTAKKRANVNWLSGTNLGRTTEKFSGSKLNVMMTNQKNQKNHFQSWDNLTRHLEEMKESHELHLRRLGSSLYEGYIFIYAF